MLDHVSLPVRDIVLSKAFYAAALAPLGYAVLMDFPGQAAGLGVAPKPDFWVGVGTPVPPLHVAFRAESRAAVDAFYAAAIAAGGKDNGPPGVRAHYHADYYGAFVLDPDGYNVEAVSHGAGL